MTSSLAQSDVSSRTGAVFGLSVGLSFFASLLLCFVLVFVRRQHSRRPSGLALLSLLKSFAVQLLFESRYAWTTDRSLVKLLSNCWEFTNSLSRSFGGASRNATLIQLRLCEVLVDVHL